MRLRASDSDCAANGRQWGVGPKLLLPPPALPPVIAAGAPAGARRSVALLAAHALPASAPSAESCRPQVRRAKDSEAFGIRQKPWAPPQDA